MPQAYSVRIYDEFDGSLIALTQLGDYGNANFAAKPAVESLHVIYHGADRPAYAVLYEAGNDMRPVALIRRFHKPADQTADYEILHHGPGLYRIAKNGEAKPLPQREA